jgi:hypothetical protein
MDDPVGEGSFRKATVESDAHYSSRMQSLGTGNRLISPEELDPVPRQDIECRERRLGGLLNYYRIAEPVVVARSNLDKIAQRLARYQRVTVLKV